MQQVKVFKHVESEVDALEKEVNTWIRQSGVKVISVTGNIAPQTPGQSSGGTGGLGRSGFSSSDVLLIVLYEAPSK